MLYYTSIPENNKSDYSEIYVNDRVFYYKKDDVPKQTMPRRRYSNNLKDPLFLAKDKFKELSIVKQSRTKYNDIQFITRQYIDCIEKCMDTLNKDFNMPFITMFQAFDLRKAGFNPEDFGIETEELENGTE